MGVRSRANFGRVGSLTGWILPPRKHHPKNYLEVVYGELCLVGLYREMSQMGVYLITLCVCQSSSSLVFETNVIGFAISNCLSICIECPLWVFTHACKITWSFCGIHFPKSCAAVVVAKCLSNKYKFAHNVNGNELSKPQPQLYRVFTYEVLVPLGGWVGTWRILCLVCYGGKSFLGFVQ